MSWQEFDEVLERCLSLLEGGVSVDECVAAYPQYAEELRAQLGVAQTLLAARPQFQPDPSAQGRGRARLLAAVALQREAAEPEPTLGLVAPLRALFASWRRLRLVPQALPAVLAMLI